MRMKKPAITRSTVAEINLKALKHNLIGIRQKVGPDVEIMTVVKANAYGHGSIEVARYLESNGVCYFGVAFPEEGVELRRAGIKSPIHVFTLPVQKQIPLFFDYKLEPTICSLLETALLEKEGIRRKRTLKVHLKIDSGMNRIGVKTTELNQFLAKYSKNRRLEIKGVYTHFAEVINVENSFTFKQLDEFEKGLEIVHKAGIVAEYIHCANSAAILQIPKAYYSMVRPGIALYGGYPSETTSDGIGLQQVMKFRTRIALLKWIELGESVSYNRIFTANRKTQIATLPIGYADGLMRSLTGKATCLINGKEYPIVGTICMDQTMVDVGSDDVHVGDEVVLWGNQRSAEIKAVDVANKIGTIPYELFCAVSARVPREYKR
jgi:alanine racemase